MVIRSAGSSKDLLNAFQNGRDEFENVETIESGLGPDLQQQFLRGLATPRLPLAAPATSS